MSTTKQEIKERGIILDAAEVRGIIEGRRSQLRRIIKSQPQFFPSAAGGSWGWYQGKPPCPFGEPGNRLWVRETCRAEGLGVRYLADDSYAQTIGEDIESHDRFCRMHNYRGGFGCTVPAIHMPRWASRITLEITGVRVERLNEISEADCWLEGIEEVMHDFDDQSQYLMAKRLGCCIEDAKPLFAQLWESKNGEGSWDDNPWVWVIEFKRIEA